MALCVGALLLALHQCGALIPLLVLALFMLRVWQRRHSHTSHTLLTSMRFSRRDPKVTRAVQRRTHVEHDLNIFRVATQVEYIGGELGTIQGFDGDGDLLIITKSGRRTTWYVSKCTKAVSLGDRVRHVDGQEAVVADFDLNDDLMVVRADGARRLWCRSECSRLLNPGDRVHYPCGEAARVVGIDDDGDVVVQKACGRQAVWLAKNCTPGFGPRPEKEEA